MRRKGFRRHHNNKGARTMKTGKVKTQLEQIAKRLGIPFVKATGGSVVRDSGIDPDPCER